MMRIPRIFQYVGVAGLAALVNLLSRILYSQWLGFTASVTLAYATGHVVNFFLARHVVFGASRNAAGHAHLGQFARFSLVAAAGYLVTLGVSAAMRAELTALDWPALGEEAVAVLAHLSGIGLAFFTNYFGHLLFSFGGPTAQQKGESR